MLGCVWRGWLKSEELLGENGDYFDAEAARKCKTVTPHVTSLKKVYPNLPNFCGKDGLLDLLHHMVKVCPSCLVCDAFRLALKSFFILVDLISSKFLTQRHLGIY
jgi:hypothetical protein